MINKTRSMTEKPFGVNVFCHAHAQRNEVLEKAWIERFRELFARYEAVIPPALTEIYSSFQDNESMADVLLAAAPACVSFHFGVPSSGVVNRFRKRGMVTCATATNVREALLIEAAGIDFIVAQGYEAGGHRGIFEPREEDSQHSTFTLVQTVRKACRIPVIAAGGIMDGAGIAAMLRIGACGVQMGTAFVLCPESSANEAYRQALKNENAASTMMVTAISGRPARCITNDFCALSRDIAKDCIPPYPLAYALGKSLAAAAAARGDHGFGAQWAGQGAALAREMPAADLVRTLVSEIHGA